MARSDLLLALVHAGLVGDTRRFRQAVEALAAQERTKQHHVLADQLLARLQGGQSDRTPSLLAAADGVDRLVYELRADRSLDDLLLPDVVRSACQELFEEQHRADILRAHNLAPRHRVLLAGPPGNGKTSLAEAIAHDLMVPMYVLRYEGVIGSFLGETASRLRKVFDYVRGRPCVLFLDEFDTLGKERGDPHDTGEIKRVVSSLLLQIDNVDSHVVVVTATNHPELLDRAVWRRFQLRLELPMPSKHEISTWLERLEQRLGFDLECNKDTIAQSMKGCSYAEVEEFALDVARTRLLRLTDGGTADVVRKKLEQWKARFTT